MIKENWVKHIESISGLIRPSISGNKIAWRDFVRNHISPAGFTSKQVPCPICKERTATRKALKNRQAKDQAMRDCGLVKVKGALGGVYWE